MSALGSVLNTALKSMEVSQLALSVASNNISNAQTPGYTRQRLVTEASPPIFDAGMYFGTGSEAVRVEALRSEFIERRLKQETSALAREENFRRSLADVEVVFNDTADTGMSETITRFFNSFHALAQDPASVSARELIRQTANTLVGAFRTRADHLATVQTSVDRAIAEDVARINDLSAQIARVSGEVVKHEVAGQAANDLRDKRSSLVRQLSEIIDVGELESGNVYQLATAGGRSLVVNGESIPLAVRREQSGLYSVRYGPDNITAEIGAGQLKAGLMIRDQSVPQYLSQLDQLAFEIADQVNRLHSAGYNLEGNTGVNLFAPLASAAGAARQIQLDPAIRANASRIAAGSQAQGTDNATARALANLLHSPVFSGGSVIDQYSSLVFRIGSDLQDSENHVGERQALVRQLENRRDAASGVSIDQETVDILQFQRAYQASARMVQVVDEMLEAVLAMR